MIPARDGLMPSPPIRPGKDLRDFWFVDNDEPAEQASDFRHRKRDEVACGSLFF